MPFRVYSKKENCWAKGEFCLSSRDDLFRIKRTRFGNDKLELLSDNDYVVQHCTGATDSVGNMMYEGDICGHTEVEDLVGVIAYSTEHACYYLFEDKNSAYYRLYEDARNEMKIVGNVFDNADLLHNHDKEQ